MKVRGARHAIAFLIGLGATLAVHTMTGWWLNSGGGVASMLLVLGTVSALVARLSGGPIGGPAISLWCGGFVGMVATLVWTGPGTIWPIVIAVAGAFSAAAVAVGALAGRSLRPRKGTAR
jgi:hypothetical protein